MGMSTESLRKGIWIKYGMTEAQHVALVTMKPGCWICARTTKKDGSQLRLYTDHDHKTGRVRGRLCYACNRRLIGRRRDGGLYRKAATYLDSKFDGRDIKTGQSWNGKTVRLPRRPTRSIRRAC